MKNSILASLQKHFADIAILGLLQKQFAALVNAYNKAAMGDLQEVISTWVVDCCGKDVLFLASHAKKGVAYVYHVRMCKTVEGTNDHLLFVEQIGDEGGKLLDVKDWEIKERPIGPADFKARRDEGWEFLMIPDVFKVGYDKVKAINETRAKEYEAYKKARAKGDARPF